jgi:hypothetical protein
VQQLIEPLSGFGIAEHDFAEPFAIHAAIWEYNLRAERLGDAVKHRTAGLDHFPRYFIGIDHKRSAALKHAAYRTFPTGNASG